MIKDDYKIENFHALIKKNEIRLILANIKLAIVQLMLFAAGLVVLILAMFQQDPNPLINFARVVFGVVLLIMSGWSFGLK